MKSVLSSTVRYLNRCKIACAVGIAVLSTSHAGAQCTGFWAPGQGQPGVSSTVYAIASFPDGAKLFGGDFSSAGSILAKGVAKFDPITSTFSPLGAGLNTSVFSITIAADGSPIAGGLFTASGNTPMMHAARWDGTAWVQLGDGLNGTVYSVIKLPNGDILAGGSFTAVNGPGGTPLAHIARWNGTAWSQVGTGVNGEVRAIVLLPDGDVAIAGLFSTAGSVPLNNVARWDGSSWSAMGTGLLDTVWALTVMPSGDLIAGGDFNTAAGSVANRVARWDSAANSGAGAWTPLGSGMNSGVRSLTVMPNGRLVATGGFTLAGGVGVTAIAQWDGAAWSPLAPSTTIAGGAVFASAPRAEGGVIIGGAFTTANGAVMSRVASWDGTAWLPFGHGIDDLTTAVAALPNGNVAIGGWFTTAGAPRTSHIALGVGAGAGAPAATGTVWSATSTGTGMASNVFALKALANGDLMAGGQFGTAGGIGGVPALRIARWSGGTWSALGQGFDYYVDAIEELPGGDIIAGGEFMSSGTTYCGGIARWTGSLWSPMGHGTNGSVFALTLAPTIGGGSGADSGKDVVAGGSFTLVGPGTGISAPRIARWDGSVWTPLGPGLNGIVYALARLPNGDIVAGGVFSATGDNVTPLASIARWDGSAWRSMGSGMNGRVNALAVLSNGNLVAGGTFTTAGGVAAGRVAQWNGSSWGPVGTGAGATETSLPSVNALAALLDGGFVMTGYFAKVDGQISSCFARWVPPAATPCGPADIGGQGGFVLACGDGALNNNDFIAFINLFFANDPRADRGAVGGLPGSDQAFDNNDFIVFINQFFTGC